VSLTIRTNNVPRHLFYDSELGPAELKEVKSEFDYLSDSEIGETCFFRYRKQWYCLADFITLSPENQWQGYFGLTAWSAIYVKIVKDCESIVVGFAHW
jgi:hypothetical protein